MRWPCLHGFQSFDVEWEQRMVTALLVLTLGALKYSSEISTWFPGQETIQASRPITLYLIVQ